MKAIVTIFILLFSVHFISRVNTVHAQETVLKTPEEVEGLYFMHGIQINKDLCYIGTACEPGEVLSSETLKTSFIVYVQSREDLLVFHGLEGAATSVEAPNHNESSAAFPNCTNDINVDTCASTELIGDSVTFTLEAPGGAYYGEGIFKDGGLTLETIFIYRGLEVEFSLEGRKIKEEI